MTLIQLSYISQGMSLSGLFHLLPDNTSGHTRYCEWFRELKIEKWLIDQMEDFVKVFLKMIIREHIVAFFCFLDVLLEFSGAKYQKWWNFFFFSKVLYCPDVIFEIKYQRAESENLHSYPLPLGCLYVSILSIFFLFIGAYFCYFLNTLKGSDLAISWHPLTVF